MLFNSVAFALFFPLAMIFHFLIPSRTRWLGLLIAGHIFYMSFIPWYIGLLWGAILLDYTAGRCIESASTRRGKNIWLIGSIFGTAGLLAIFKYGGWLSRSIHPIAQLTGIPLPVIECVVPLGLSFHTFQSLAYVIEVRNGRYPAERNLGIYALYVLFWPQLVAGPIERPQELLAKLRTFPDFDAETVSHGLRRMTWGFFLKIGVADRLGQISDVAFAPSSQLSSPAAWCGLIAFAGQIYFDFAGYSEIARGCANCMGIDLVKNFDRPWKASVPSEFWHGWHMSLSRWFRDYVYIPLGGSRAGAIRHSINLLITFGLSGLWHGAGAGFVIWGLWNGFLLVIERWIRPILPARKNWFQFSAIRILSLLAILLSWVFFRANDTPHAMRYFSFLLSVNTQGSILIQLGSSPFPAGLALFGILAVGLTHHITEGDPIAWYERQAFLKRCLISWALLSFVAFCGVFDGEKFIYFQF